MRRRMRQRVGKDAQSAEEEHRERPTEQAAVRSWPSSKRCGGTAGGERREDGRRVGQSRQDENQLQSLKSSRVAQLLPVSVAISLSVRAAAGVGLNERDKRCELADQHADDCV